MFETFVLVGIGFYYVGSSLLDEYYREQAKRRRPIYPDIFLFAHVGVRKPEKFEKVDWQHEGF